jgi:hypothetical protein
MYQQSNQRTAWPPGARRQAVFENGSTGTGRLSYTAKQQPITDDESLQRRAKRPRTRQTYTPDQNQLSIPGFDTTWSQSQIPENLSYSPNTFQTNRNFELEAHPFASPGSPANWDHTNSLGVPLYAQGSYHNAESAIFTSHSPSQNQTLITSANRDQQSFSFPNFSFLTPGAPDPEEVASPGGSVPGRSDNLSFSNFAFNGSSYDGK